MRFPIVLSALLLIGCSPVIHRDGDPFPISRNSILAKHHLIEVRKVDPKIAVDLIYKTAANLTKAPLYSPEMPALLRPETAQRLARANELVGAKGYRLKIWDAYRPPEAQIKLWDASGHNDLYVANPYHAASQHSCGTAVDVTLVFPNGEEAKMPTPFDSFSPAASCNAISPDPEVRANLKILQDAMKEAGFYMLTAEWWHFIDVNYRRYPQTIAWSEISDAF